MPGRYGLGPRPDFAPPRGPRPYPVSAALDPGNPRFTIDEEWASEVEVAALERANAERTARHERRMTGG